MGGDSRSRIVILFGAREPPLPFDGAGGTFEYAVGKTKHKRQSSMKEWRKSTTTRASIMVRMGTTPATRTKMPLPSIPLAFCKCQKKKNSILKLPTKE
jgi:hypothetical protein